MTALAYMRRQQKLNSEFYPTHWLDVGRDWLKRRGYSTNINLRAIVAAAICSNVPYSSLSTWPHNIELGLARGDIAKPSNAWRDDVAPAV